MSRCTYFQPIHVWWINAGVMNKYHLMGLHWEWMSVSTELLHQPQAICRNISLAFKARLLCKQKALQPPPEQVALCAEVADALADVSECFTQGRTGTKQARVWALPRRPSAQRCQDMAHLLAWHPQGKERGCGQKNRVYHGNCFIEEIFTFTGEGWEQIRNGEERSS